MPTYSKMCLIKECENLIEKHFKGNPFKKPLKSFRAKDLKVFIKLYENKKVKK